MWTSEEAEKWRFDAMMTMRASFVLVAVDLMRGRRPWVRIA